MKNFVSFIVLMFVGHFTCAQEIEVEKLDKSTFRLTLTHGSVLDIGVAQGYLDMPSKSLCGNLKPIFGKYSFESAEPIGVPADAGVESSFKFVQEIQCSSKREETKSVTEKYLRSESEAEVVMENVRSLSKRYLEDIANGRYDEAYSAIADSMRVFSTKDSWVSEKNLFRLQVGKAKRIKISKLTIYDNPQDAPEPGLYVAADYFNEFSNAPIHCGYLMWFKDRERSFKVIREESGFVTSEQIEKIPSEQLSMVKRKLHCVEP